MIYLEQPLYEIKGIGPKFLTKLEHFKIKTVRDLLRHFPFRYEDFSEVLKIIDLQVGQEVTVQGVIEDIKPRKSWKRGMFIIEAKISDETGSIKAIWFNQRFLLAVLKKGRLVSLSGKVVAAKNGSLCLSHPTHEFINQAIIESEQKETKHTARLVPIYPETRGFTSKAFRYLIKPILDELEPVEESLPKEILDKYKILGIDEALYKIHFPDDIKETRLARERFAFEDLFYLQIMNLKEKLRLAMEKAHAFKIDLDYIKKLLEKIPFELTVSQKKSLWEILKDLEKPRPMNRLLQGDVGSGKTIVAVIAALAVAKPFDGTQGKQAAFMAPTEILTNQHYQTFKFFFSDFNNGIGLITSSGAKVFYGDGLETDVKKPELIKKIQTGEIKIIFGTHSLIQKSIKFGDLGFVVIDEQHRFGVRQRARLVSGNGGEMPHFLSMSATPIPRTLSLTVFGDLDLSIIDELPKGRKEIITKIVSTENRDKAYAFIRGQVKKGRQVFVICPRIELTIDDMQPATKENKNNLWGMWDDVKNVKDEYEKLSKKVFPDLKVGMLHGKMKAKEKEQIMKDFKDGKTDILVSTSVIEVGVDIPNATIMIIESSERFGLAQLYQFRGRVGRGEHQSFCFLFTELKSQNVLKRLRSLINAKSGFELAEKDLEFRGPGEFLGQLQTGIPDLAMRSLQNPEIVKEAREAAVLIIQKDPNLKNYPQLLKKLKDFQQQIHME
ncbi:MAG: ATP-dependent DNA helicase RecG [Patescibacteria group bacterium]